MTIIIIIISVFLWKTIFISFIKINFKFSFQKIILFYFENIKKLIDFFLILLKWSYNNKFPWFVSVAKAFITVKYITIHFSVFDYSKLYIYNCEDLFFLSYKNLITLSMLNTFYILYSQKDVIDNK